MPGEAAAGLGRGAKGDAEPWEGQREPAWRGASGGRDGVSLLLEGSFQRPQG